MRRHAAAFLLPFLVFSATALSGCASINDYLDKVGTVRIYVTGTNEVGDLKDFRSVDLVFEAFTVKDRTLAENSDTPVRKVLEKTVDLKNGGLTLVWEAKVAQGQYNISSMTVSIKSAVLQDGTRVDISTPTTPSAGTYSLAPQDITGYVVNRAKDTSVKLTFAVYLNTAEMRGPDGEYFLTWDKDRTGRFVPA